MDSLASKPFRESLLLQPGVTLDLMSCRYDRAFLEKGLDFSFRKVTDANSLDLVFGECLHSLPSVNVRDVRRFGVAIFVFGKEFVARFECRWPVHQK